MPATADLAAQLAFEVMQRQSETGSKREVAELWAGLYHDFFAAILWPTANPALRPAALSAARDAAVEILAASSSSMVGGVPVFTWLTDTAAVMLSFATAIATTTLPPIPGFVVTPPAAPFVPAGSLVSTADAAAAFGASLFAWLQTGTAALAAPGSPVVPWA